MKKALEIEQFTSIIELTEHGLQRLLERGFKAKEIIELFNTPNYIKIQNNGARALIKQVGVDSYNLVVLSLNDNKIVTCLRHTDMKALINLGKGYGWVL